VATPQELAEGLRDVLRTISGLRVYDTMNPKPEPPAACILGPTAATEYDVTLDGGDDGLWRPVFDIEVFVASSELPRAQQALRAYVSPKGDKSIPAAIYGDPTLGGRAQFARVTRISRSPVLVETSGGQMLNTVLSCEVTST
jgi:hypothetical protein